MAEKYKHGKMAEHITNHFASEIYKCSCETHISSESLWKNAIPYNYEYIPWSQKIKNGLYKQNMFTLELIRHRDTYFAKT